MNLRWAALVALCIAAAAPARAEAWAVLHPEAVVPGGVFQVKVGHKSGPVTSAEARFQNTDFTLAPVRDVYRTLVGVPASMSAGSYAVVVTVNGETVRRQITVRNRNLPSQNIRMPASRTNLMDPEILAREREIINAAFDRLTPQPLWTEAFVVPAQGRTTSQWGRRRTVNGRPWGQHNGADIAAATGTRVNATNAGVVSVAQELWMRGNTVIIDHGFGVHSMYNHLDKIEVQPGQTVSRGQRIGTVGATGFVTGAHLHWEIRVGRTSVDPWPVVSNGMPLG
jgi:murein DD-endopeptidase MepM/ murein hydrolase activator NlpD